MPSKRSRKVGLATGKTTSVGATEPVPQTVTPPVAALICDWPWFSPAVPVTVTTSPSLTASALLNSKTKMPSEVAGLPSPEASWR